MKAGASNLTLHQVVTLSLLDTVHEVADKIAPGRAPNFIETHIVKALMKVDAMGPVGRLTLSKEMGLGEGTTRTLTKHLERDGLIHTTKNGIALTKRGKKLALDLKSRIGQEIELPQNPLTLGPFNIAFIMKDAAKGIGSGLEQRDAAIKVGALGATTLFLRNGKLIMPKIDEDLSVRDKATHELLISKLRPKQDDVIIIGSANSKLNAEFGAIAAVLETLKKYQ
jgi:predicted transcriptional regulator